MLVPQLDRPLRLDDYREIAPEEQLDKARDLAADLKGLRIVHVNSTADGGGVAEILRSLVPLMRDVGLDAQWLVMPGHEAFFEITKKLHNLMQGADGVLSAQEVSTYVAQSWKVSRAMQEQGISADIWVMHDPQSLPLAAFLPQNQRAMWVCHIDTTAPNQSAAGALLPWLQAYPLIVFSLPQYNLTCPGALPDSGSSSCHRSSVGQELPPRRGNCQGHYSQAGYRPRASSGIPGGPF